MPDILSPFVTSSFPYWTAFLAGLFGGVHCVGMCGGIVSALSFGLPERLRANRWHMLPHLLAYNTGRICSYAVGGALIGQVGMVGGELLAQYSAWVYLRAIAALFMVAMGLYLGGWWLGLGKLEAHGGRLWQRLRPLGRGLMPVRHPAQALGLGLLWGWLPCGLVYTALVWAFAAGGWQQGALFMLAFGLGTLPTLVGLGYLTASLANWVRRPRVRQLAGGLVILFGAWTLAATLVHQPNVGLGCVPPGG